MVLDVPVEGYWGGHTVCDPLLELDTGIEWIT